MTSAPRRPETILIVDDEEYNVDYLEQNLEDLGFRTLAAYGGGEALEQVRESAPDLVLLDVMMPDIDGITVCRMLKADPKTRLIPIIIMTALDGQEDRIRGIEAGADDFLSKPVDERELIARINSLLRSKQVVDETVGELESAATRLEEIGELTEDGAIAVVEFRPGSGEADDLYNHVRHRMGQLVASASERRNGQVVSDSDKQMVVHFRGEESPLARALNTAQGIRRQVSELVAIDDLMHVGLAIAVSAGEITSGTNRVVDGRDTAWKTTLAGLPVDEAHQLVASADPGTVAVPLRISESVGGGLSGERASLVDSQGEGFSVFLIAADQDEFDLSPVHGGRARRLETIFVSDIVGSTQIAGEMGDGEWTEQLDAHYRLVRDVFRRFGGREVSTAGDGFLALFGVPAEAIRAGHALARESKELGLPVRVGIHTGELEESGSDVQGIAVHLAARLADQAGESEVVVSATTMDAVAGSGLEFELKGRARLRGFEGERHLYVAKPPS